MILDVDTELPDCTALHETLWSALHGMGSPLKASAGLLLFREGEPVRGIFLLEKGAVRLSLGKNRKTITYRVAKPKYILGLPATLLNRPYSLTAEVVEDAELIFIEWTVAMDYLRAHGDICMLVLEFLSHEMVWIRNIHAAQLEGGKPTS